MYDLYPATERDISIHLKPKDDEYVTVLFGGSGTSVMESTISSVINYQKSLLIIIHEMC